MIKRILVALDKDLDTEVAIQYAVNMAARYDAEVNGLTVVDLERIESSSRGGGIGSFYYARKLVERLTEESRQSAKEISSRFEHHMADAGVRYGTLDQEGVPFERIVEDMKYHDLLIMGENPHFFYAHPKQDTHTVARVVKNTIAPTLVVGETFREINKVLVAYDGSDASARAIRRFLHLCPFGMDTSIDLIHVYHKDDTESQLLLGLMKAYIESHNMPCKTISVSGDSPKKEIIGYASMNGSDLLGAGAHSVSGIKRIAFGSTTTGLLEDCPVPLFVDN